MTSITKQYKLNFFDITMNSNKVWIGMAFADGTFETRWGRVTEGAQLASSRKKFGSASSAEWELEKKRGEKIAKGYRDAAVIEGEVEIKAPAAGDLKQIAAREIVGADDKTTLELIEYLAEVNIHHILSSTSIKYNAASATFSTPLGVLSPAALAEARSILKQIDGYNAAGDLRAEARKAKITEYFRLVPKDFGRKIPQAHELLATPAKVRKETDILDALESALQNVQSSASVQPVFKCRLSKVPHWTDEGRDAFRRVRYLFEQTKNSSHNLTAGLKLKRLYEVEIDDMKANFERESARIGNVKSDLWHGSKASNLLSILRSGLVIPPASAAHCTGRMFGNGIYTSKQSTKALNYATAMWNRSGPQNQRRFMFLCDVALGRTFKPQTSSMRFPAPGSDSTWVEAGTAGVVNHECIVYDVSQINLRYLCEFGD